MLAKLGRIIDVTLTDVTLSNLAFRGHREVLPEDDEKSVSFINIIQLLDKYDDVWENFLKSQKAP